MIKNFEYKGRWKLPQTDIWYDGTLSFNSNSEAELEIFGTFNQTFWNKTNKEIILGETTFGNVTLVDNWYRTAKHVNNDVTIEIYRPGFVFEGYHFDNESDIKFRKVALEVFNLFQWFDNKSIELTTDFDGSHYSIKYDKPDDLLFNLHSNCNGSVSFKSPISFGEPYNKIELSEQAYIVLNYEEEINYKEILLDLSYLTDLITYFSFEQSYPMSISFKNENYIKKSHIQPNENYIKCFYQISLDISKYKLRIPSEHLVKYQDIKEILPNVINKWYEFHSKYDSIIVLMLKSFKDKYLFSSDKFMDNIRALESFHRHTHNNERIPKEKFNLLVESILKKVVLKNDDRQWLENRLKGNEPSLNKRLKELIRVCCLC